ncbi:MAG TPA: LuxR C-terminal-related transcriptional regulator, partial [Rhodothermales bacterium]
GEAALGIVAEALEGSLPESVRTFACGLLGRAPTPASGAVPMFRQQLAEPLTERQQEVLFHLSRSLSYQGIADLLFVSHDTVKTHVKHIYAKLGVASRAEAVQRARDVGLAVWDSGDPR